MNISYQTTINSFIRKAINLAKKGFFTLPVNTTSQSNFMIYACYRINYKLLVEFISLFRRTGKIVIGTSNLNWTQSDVKPRQKKVFSTLQKQALYFSNDGRFNVTHKANSPYKLYIESLDPLKDSLALALLTYNGLEILEDYLITESKKGVQCIDMEIDLGLEFFDLT